MAYLISWVLWLLYVLVITAAMYAFLSFCETAVSRMLGCSCYYIYDFEGILTKRSRFLYEPMVTPEVSTLPLVLPKKGTAPTIDRYEAYRRGVRQVLEAKWALLPDHVISTAMDTSKDETLALAPTAEDWAPKVLAAASGWLAADTGLPSELVQHVLSIRDLDDQVRLADMELVLMDMATDYKGVKDLADVQTVAAVFLLLRDKGRPMMKAGDYIKAAAAYGAVETTDPSLLKLFSHGGMSNEQWLSLRYRSRDF